VALRLHAASLRSDQGVCRSKLRRHPRGAIEVRAVRARQGQALPGRSITNRKFEKADCGTLFLDEVGDMSLHAVQGARVLEGATPRAGGVDRRSRMFASSPLRTRNSKTRCARKDFREDSLLSLEFDPVHRAPLRDPMPGISRFLPPFSVRVVSRYDASREELGEASLGVMPVGSMACEFRSLLNLTGRL